MKREDQKDTLDHAMDQAWEKLQGLFKGLNKSGVRSSPHHPGTVHSELHALVAQLRQERATNGETHETDIAFFVNELKKVHPVAQGERYLALNALMECLKLDAEVRAGLSTPDTKASIHHSSSIPTEPVR